MHFCNPLKTRNIKTGTLANSEDPDEMTYNVTFHQQGSHRLEKKYLNLEGFLEKSLKIKSALKSTGKSLKSLEKSLNSTFFCRTLHC